MTLPRSVKAVVFDMDGLLVDTETVYFAAMRAAAADLGREMPRPLYLSMIGLTWADNRRQVLEHFGSDFDSDGFLEGIRGHFLQLTVAEVALKAGVLEILEALDGFGLPRAIATSSGRGDVERHLGHHGLLGRFHAIVAHGDYARPKPNPDPYLLAAQRLGVAPQDCLALEDSHNGVRAAASAGMMTIMVPDVLEPTEEMHSLCIRIARDLHEVHELLRNLT
jgi:HAD superfamily hydrolase (TIGR01509 family)